MDDELVAGDGNREFVRLCSEEIPSPVRAKSEGHVSQSQPVSRIVDPGMLVGQRAVDGTIDNLAAAF
ncbi:hypothetical protein JCM17092_27750 [Haloplanus litoreus]